MFLTFEGLEGRVPAQARDAGFEYWGAAVMPNAVPWYVANIRRKAGARPETLFIACESMLVELLSDLDGAEVLSLMRFDPSDESEWTVAKVREVWCDWRLPEGERLFFRLQSEVTLRNSGLKGWLLTRVGQAPLLAA
jgi:hypothetical protein